MDIADHRSVAAAIQYYHVASIILLLLKAQCISRPIDTEELQEAEYHALQVCGLAYTNDDPAVTVNSFGPLAFSGKFLQSDQHRKVLLVMLDEFVKPTAWPVQRIIDDLERHWKGGAQRDT
jgi:hypothetical protein